MPKAGSLASLVKEKFDAGDIEVILCTVKLELPVSFPARRYVCALFDTCMYVNLPAGGRKYAIDQGALHRPEFCGHFRVSFPLPALSIAKILQDSQDDI